MVALNEENEESASEGEEAPLPEIPIPEDYQQGHPEDNEPQQEENLEDPEPEPQEDPPEGAVQQDHPPEGERNDLLEGEPDLEDWAEWLKDDWYGDIIYYKLMGEIRNADTPSESRNIRRRALKFVLVNREPNALCYREKSGQLAQCC